eukprot:499235-Rhodomonas_salina.1
MQAAAREARVGGCRVVWTRGRPWCEAVCRGRMNTVIRPACCTCLGRFAHGVVQRYIVAVPMSLPSAQAKHGHVSVCRDGWSVVLRRLAVGG